MKPKSVRRPRKELGHLVAEDWIKTIWSKTNSQPLEKKAVRRLARRLVDELKRAGWESPRDLKPQIQAWAEPQGHDRWRAVVKMMLPLQRCTAKQADDMAMKMAKFFQSGWDALNAKAKK